MNDPVVFLIAHSWATFGPRPSPARHPRAGGALADVIGPPPGELYSGTNDNSVAILLTCGMARVLLAGDAEGREEEYMASGSYTRP